MCAISPLASLLSQCRLRAAQTPFCAAFISKHNNSSCMLGVTVHRFLRWLQLNVAQSSSLFHVKG